jgi:hypothetical protein
MFGLDHNIASLGAGQTFVIVAIVAVLLGLRHATDPDHLTAVTTLIAGERDHAHPARRARSLGFVWGLGQATTLFAFGLPIVLCGAYLPEAAQEAAEAAVGVMIVALALRLLVRWRHAHTHRHAPRRVRGPLQAFGIGLVHGAGGSAGIGVLLLAGIHQRAEAVAALGLFAACTALSMALASTSFGFLLARASAGRGVLAATPALGAFSLLFGVWYALGAIQAVPYVF